MEKEKQLSFGVALAIVVVLIAGAFFFSKKFSSKKEQSQNDVLSFQDKRQELMDSEIQKKLALLENLRPLSEDDHILGSKDADILIYEYVDLECPFCKKFHFTLKKIMEKYGKDNKVALVFRNFPLDTLHSKARKEAKAAECAYDQGGNEAFFKYVDEVFSVTPSNNGLNLKLLPKIAEKLDLDVDKFNACLNSDKFDAKIQADVENALKTGGNGTPWIIFVTKSGKKYPLAGALSFEQMDLIIKEILNAEKNQ